MAKPFWPELFKQLGDHEIPLRSYGFEERLTLEQLYQLFKQRYEHEGNPNHDWAHDAAIEIYNGIINHTVAVNVEQLEEIILKHAGE